jgi:hypothetical protein
LWIEVLTKKGRLLKSIQTFATAPFFIYEKARVRA